MSPRAAKTMANSDAAFSRCLQQATMMQQQTSAPPPFGFGPMPMPMFPAPTNMEKLQAMPSLPAVPPMPDMQLWQQIMMQMQLMQGVPPTVLPSDMQMPQCPPGQFIGQFIAQPESMLNGSAGMPSLDAEFSASAQPSGVAAWRGNVWLSAQDPEKDKELSRCRQLQDFLEKQADSADILELVVELHGHVVEAMRCPNANHVLQMFIEKVPSDNLQFVINELGAYGFVAAAKHKFGCRIVQRLLEHVAPAQLTPLVAELVPASVELSRHASGHFVMACLLERGQDFERDVIAATEALTQFVSLLQPHERIHTSNKEGEPATSHQRGESFACVLKAALEDKCMTIESEAMEKAQVDLASALLDRPDVLTDMVSAHEKGFRYGPETVKLAVEMAGAGPDLLTELIGMTTESTRYGRELKKKLQQQLEDLQETEDLQEEQRLETVTETESKRQW